jgi:hypothetical protein
MMAEDENFLHEILIKINGMVPFQLTVDEAPDGRN